MKGTCNGRIIVPGVVAGSHHGHYVAKHAVEMALDLGWEDADAQAAVDTYDNNYFDPDWYFFDVWFDIIDDAEKWLNDHTEGALWYFYDGDFRVDATVECSHCGEQRFADPLLDDADGEYCGNHLVIEF